MNKLNIKNRILISFLLILILGFLGSALVVSKLAKEQIINREMDLAAKRSNELSKNLEGYYEVAQDKLKKSNLLVNALIKHTQFNGLEINFNDQIFKQAFFNKETSLIGNNEPAEQFYRATKSHFTLFLKSKDDFIRVSTSLKSSSGKSLLGTKLNKNGKAFQSLKNNEYFQGIATIQKNHYLTSYQPIMENNKLIGIAFVGVDIHEAIKSMLDNIKNVKWGNTGFSYLVDKKGKVIYHPNIAEGKSIDVGFIKKNQEGIHYSENNSEKITIVKDVSGWDYILVNELKKSEYLSLLGTMNKILLTSSVLVCLLGLMILIIVINLAFKPLKELNKFMGEMAQGEGDLTIRLASYGNNEVSSIAVHINTFISNLQMMMKDLSCANDSIKPEVHSLSVQAIETKDMVDRHLIETEQVVTALEEMGATSLSVAQNAEHAAISTKDAALNVASSQKSIDEATLSVSNLVSVIDNTSIQMEQMNQNTSQISKVLEVIGQIADQTNLLALNAAIEAARAGEQGRGFAVVADEVRNLALRTQRSTAEINSKLIELNNGAEGVSQAMEKTKECCNEAAEKSSDVKDSINLMSGSVEEITELNDQIATAAVEQNAVVEEINKNMNEIITVVNKIAENSTQTGDMSSRLSTSNDRLSEMVNRFKLG